VNLILEAAISVVVLTLVVLIALVRATQAKRRRETDEHARFPGAW
jgi:hypothetical protein